MSEGLFVSLPLDQSAIGQEFEDAIISTSVCYELLVAEPGLRRHCLVHVSYFMATRTLLQRWLIWRLMLH
jgi:hypothetical protein